MKDKGWTTQTFLLDGFPRNKENITEWKKQMKDTLVEVMLYFECPDDVLVSRLTKRGASSGRADDNEETIKK